MAGGAGLIGRVIIEELARAGHTPVVYDSLVKGHISVLQADIPMVNGDVRDTDHLKTALRDYKIEAIIWC